MARKMLRRFAASLVSLAMLASLVPPVTLAEEADLSAPAAVTATEATPSPEPSPDTDATPVPEVTPVPETTPVPEVTPTQEATPVPEATPAQEATPVPEATPAQETPAETAPESAPLRNAAPAAAPLSDSGYNFGMTDEGGYILVEKNWVIHVWDDLPAPTSTQEMSSKNIASYSALGTNNTSLGEVDRTDYLSITIKGSAGRTFTVTGLRYKITNDDGSVTYATWQEKPAETADYVVEKCEWRLKISGHIYSTDPNDATVTKEPTCTENGERSYDCQLCHQTPKTEAIPALHSALGSGEACPQCGLVPFTWDESTKTLTIGADVPHYTQSNYTSRPYQQYADQAQRVVVADNVEQIGAYSFAYFTALTAFGPAGTPDKTAVLNVTTVGGSAFWNVKGMTEYTFADTVTSLSGCLYNCGTLDKVTVYNTTTSDSFGFQANEPVAGSTLVTQMVIEDPDGTLGKENLNSTWDGVLNLTIHVDKILGSARSDDLQTLTVTDTRSISDSWMYDSMWGQNVFPALTDVTLKNVGTVGQYAFSGCGIQNVTLENVDALQEGAFYECSELRNVTIQNVGLIDAYCFDYCTALTSLDVPEETKLGYSNIFDFTDPTSPFYYLKDRMMGILDGRFSLEANPAPEELTVPDGWDSSCLGSENEAALDKTQLTKSARWANTDRTTADVEFQFNYAKKQGMDFLFIIDYSGSMSKIGNYTDNTIPDETVDDNSRFFDMQSKLLDVSEQLLNTEGYDNRVAFVTFSTNESYLHTQDFTGDYATAEDFVLGYQPYGATNYTLSLSKAYEMINSRTDTSREAAVIFISDGQPNRFLDGTTTKPAEYPTLGTWAALVAQINDYADRIKGIQQFGHDTKIFGVLQSIPAADEDRCQQVLEGVATDGLFFRSSDTESFSAAINNAIGATYNVYTLTDTIDPAFTLDESSIRCSAGTYTVDTDASGNQQITWTITGVPYLTHTLDYQLQLKPNADGNYPEGAFDTNEGAAALTLGGAAVNAVATPTLARGSLLLQPADMTIYMGGEEGYEGVVTEDGVITDTGSDSLPQPGFYVTLPAELDAMMKQVWADSGDISTTQDADGNTLYVMNLSEYLRLEDPVAHKAWTLSLYSSGYSLAYAKYIYRIEPAEEGMDPIRLQFVDKETGACHTSDTFVLGEDLYQDYTIQVYNKAVQAGEVVARLRIGEDSWVSLPLSLAEGNLTIRYVTGSQEDSVIPAVEKIADAAPAQSTPLEHAGLVVNDQTQFYINNSQIPADGANVSLLFDHVVTDETEGSQDDYEQLLADTALTKVGTTLRAPQCETRYLDLVDADNGNVWLTADSPVQVYWPYPDGTNAGTRFYLVHFKDLDREMAQADLQDLLLTADTEIVPVSTDAYGISFTTDSFSPFVLVWDQPAGTPPASGSGEAANPTPTPAPAAAAASAPAAAQTVTIPQTDDPMPVVLWVTLLGCSAAGLAWTLQKKRRTNKR